MPKADEGAVLAVPSPASTFSCDYAVLWIAASALERNAVVVSEGRDFRRIAAFESLDVENWLS